MKLKSGSIITSAANLFAAAIMTGMITVPAHAQDDAGEDENYPLETIIVTGSRLQGSSENAPSPVSVFNTDDIAVSGGASIQDFLFDLPLNVGTESQPNIFNQNFSAGTENINLRGLGLSSTLVLFNGRRGPLSGAVAQDGATFVDVSVLPKVFVERVEVLKDGGSAIYGSEAVAGVTNFILKKWVTGVEIQGGFQTPFEGSGSESDIGFIAGTDVGDSTNLTVGFNFFDRDALDATERDFTAPTLNAPLFAGTSAAGQPGNFIIQGAPPGPPTPDPECATAGGFMAGPICRFNFIQFAQLQIPEQRLQSYGRIDHDFDNGIEAYAEVLLAFNEVQGQTLPLSTPTVVGGAPVIPAANPFNTLGADVGLFIGRPFGANAPAGVIYRENDTQRYAFGAKGEVGSTGWTWNAGYQYGQNKYSFNFPDVAVTPFVNALSGNDQDGNFTGVFFDVFGDTSNNSQALIDRVSVDYERAAETNLHTFDVGFSGEIFNLSAGPVGLAFGGQLRREKLDVDFGAAAETFDLGFLIGGADYSAERDIYAAYGELGIPLHETINAQVALRYESYDGFGSSVDPKIAVRWQPNNIIGLRGSFSTAFRTPSLQQAFGNQTGVEFIPGATTFVTVGNPNLKNEESQSFNIGVILTPDIDNGSLRIAVDYFDFSYDDVITVDSIGGLIADFNAGGNAPNPLLVADAFVAGTSSQVVTVGATSTVDFVVANFINAAAQDVSGVDIDLDYTVETDIGIFDLSFGASIFTKFDIRETPTGPTIDALGSRNLTNFARTLPNSRANSSIGWTYGPGRLGINIKFTDGFDNDEEFIPSPTGGEVESVNSHIVVDLLYDLDIEKTNSSIGIGILNLLDNDPPYVDTNFNFDSQIHDPRGRTGYIRFTQHFGQ